jgi:hypothetical protein
MHIFTEQEVQLLLRKTIAACGEALLEYLTEDTIIVDRLTQEEITNSELTLKPDALGIKIRIKDKMKDIVTFL